MLRAVRDARVGTIFLLIGCGIAVIIAVNAMSGTLGGLSDVQPLADIHRALRLTAPPSDPSFPLARDVLSWYLMATVPITWLIARRQWKLMTHLFPALAVNGVLASKPILPAPRLRRLLRLQMIEPSSDPADVLGPVLERARRIATRTNQLAPACLVGGLALAVLLMAGERGGLFHVLTPPGFTRSAATAWHDDAYRSWWAGIYHPPGAVFYLCAVTLGFTMILLQNGVGLAAIYVTASLGILMDLRVDWLNADGSYGWRPIARIFQTVYVALIVDISVVTTLAVLLGSSTAWIAVEIGLLLIAVPLYTVIPWLGFRRVGKIQKALRIEELREAFNAQSRSARISSFVAYRNEIARVRRAHINPLRLEPRQIPRFAAVVIIPVALAALQIAASVRAL